MHLELLESHAIHAHDAFMHLLELPSGLSSRSCCSGTTWSQEVKVACLPRT